MEIPPVPRGDKDEISCFRRETKTVPFYIDSLRAICLLRKALNSSAAQERGFSICIDGKENLASRVRHDLILSVVPSLTKIQKLAELASLERTKVVSMKRAMPLSPSTVHSATMPSAAPQTTTRGMSGRQPFSRCKHADPLSVGCAQTDSPPAHYGPQYPLPSCRSRTIQGNVPARPGGDVIQLKMNLFTPHLSGLRPQYLFPQYKLELGICFSLK